MNKIDKLANWIEKYGWIVQTCISSVALIIALYTYFKVC